MYGSIRFNRIVASRIIASIGDRLIRNSRSCELKDLRNKDFRQEGHPLPESYRSDYRTSTMQTSPNNHSAFVPQIGEEFRTLYPQYNDRLFDGWSRIAIKVFDLVSDSKTTFLKNIMNLGEHVSFGESGAHFSFTRAISITNQPRPK